MLLLPNITASYSFLLYFLCSPLCEVILLSVCFLLCVTLSVEWSSIGAGCSSVLVSNVASAFPPLNELCVVPVLPNSFWIFLNPKLSLSWHHKLFMMFKIDPEIVIKIKKKNLHFCLNLKLKFKKYY